MYTQSLMERIVDGFRTCAGVGTLYVGPLTWWADGPWWVWPCAGLAWIAAEVCDEILLRRGLPRLDGERLSRAQLLQEVARVLEPLDEGVHVGVVDGGQRRVQDVGDHCGHPSQVGGAGRFGSIAPKASCSRS